MILAVMEQLKGLKYVVISLVLVIISVNLIAGIGKSLKSTARLEEVKQQISAAQKQKEALEAEISYKQSDDYVRERARDDLNLVMPGERVFVVTGEPPEEGEVAKSGGSDGSEVLGQSSARDAANWYLWFRLFAD